MALFIQTNVASLIAQSKLSKTTSALTKSFERLSSGFRINSAADDPAGLGISDSLNGQIRSLSAAQRNQNDAISMAQTADGAAGQVSNIVARMRELAVQSANGSYNSTDRTNLNTEFQQLQNEIERIAQTVDFNGVNLLGGAVTTIAYQVGIRATSNDVISIPFGGMNTTSLGISPVDVLSVASSSAALATLDTAFARVNTTRETFGAAMNRLMATVQNTETQKVNLSAAMSRIRDVDVAEETANLSRNQVLMQAGSAVLAQANQAPQAALSLLRGN